MYQSYWGLRDSPFRSNLVMQLLQQSPTHDEALSRLHFLVENHRRLGLLMGPSGSGKSLILEFFAGQMLRHGLPVAKINLLGVQSEEFLWLLAADLKVNPDPAASTATLWRTIIDRLAEFRYQQLQAVILLDDVESADRPLLDQIARLARHDCSPEARLTVVLAGQKDKIFRLGEHLLELVDLRIDLEPWDEAETAKFLQCSLAEAGRKTPAFAASAVARLHELAGGNPRRVSQLADLSLLAGAGGNLPLIDIDVVESVYQELGPAEMLAQG
jgi:general secretion pathway protein A